MTKDVAARIDILHGRMSPIVAAECDRDEFGQLVVCVVLGSLLSFAIRNFPARQREMRFGMSLPAPRRCYGNRLE